MSKPAAPAAATYSPVRDALKPSRKVRLTLLLSSGMINVLTLTGSLFMMQVYDRVLGSQSFETLFGLGAIAVFAYVVQGILDGYRGRILVLLAEKFDAAIAPKVNAANMLLALRTSNGAQEAQRNVRHVESIRAFISGPGPVAACDLPWLPIYLLVAGILHWSLAFAIVLAALFFVWLTFMTDRRSKTPGRMALESGLRRLQEADSALHNAEAAQAMGMRPALAARWGQLNESYLLAQRTMTYTVAGYSITAKTARMLLQSLMLGLGAALAIKGQISPGAIIAASIMSTRALAPIDQAIASWKPFQQARDAYRALNDLLIRTGAEREYFELPAPHRSLSVNDLVVTLPPVSPPLGQLQTAPPAAERIVLQGVRMEVRAGSVVCVMGPSASGKSTLGRALVGVWKYRAGTIKLDDAPIDQWSPDRLGRHIGYLPQDVQLFDGTIAENISRLSADSTDDKIRSAAIAADFDKHVLSIGGFDRRIGPGGTHLSVGQRQRLGLARALYGDPFLVVLDEPNSNLDVEGEAALLAALRGIKARGGIAIVIAHNLKVLEVSDLVLAIDRGTPVVFGERDKALAYLQQEKMPPKPAAATAAPAQRLPVANSAGAANGASAQPVPLSRFEGPRLILQRGNVKGST